VIVELHHQVTQTTGAQDKFDITALSEGLEKLPLKVSRQRGDGPDTENLPRFVRAVLERIDQLFAGPKDGIGVLERDMSRLRQNQLAILPDKEGVPQLQFQLPELDTERRLGDIQAGGGLSQATLLRNRPKVSKMVIVQEHPIHILNRTFFYKRYIGSNHWRLATLTPMNPSTAPESPHGRLAVFGSQAFAILCLAGAVAAAAWLDRVTATLLLLTTGLFAVVCRYSIRYLNGDPGQARFLGWLCATGTCVFSLVLTSNLLAFALAWSATSLSLHQLLQFYRDRPGAQMAARKKFLISRLGDVCLAAVLFLTYRQFGTWDFAELFRAAEQMRGAPSASLHWICGLLVFAALLKSAQFPFHSWLPDTMETPTPVSALMHAGVINAGGILVIRLSPLISLSAPAMEVLALAGAFTAVFASLVMLTQASVKRCLAFSTVAQMGFMMLECGMGAYHLALVHVVGHSFYKAYSFLSSGSVALERPQKQRTDKPLAVFAGSLLIAACVALPVAAWTGVDPGEHAALTGIFILGAGHLLSSAWGSRAMYGVLPGAALVSFAYFGMERSTSLLLTPVHGEASWTTVPIFGLFLLLAAVQTQLTAIAGTRQGRSLYAHARNGFYINTIANRLTASVWPIRNTTGAH
jgi:NAD(P)H-quinone oxidoreductase subunit 5